MKEGANTVATMHALAETAAGELEGTCRTLHELGDEYEGAEDSTAFCARLDELVFCCVGCNWWCSQDECNETEGGEWACDDCTAETDGDG